MKIVVPIMPQSLSELKAIDRSLYAAADLVEWRADFMPLDAIAEAAQLIKAQFTNQDLIFTYRTEDKASCPISATDYERLVHTYASKFTYVDIEVLRFPSIALPANTLASYHDFTQIPTNLPDILEKLAAPQPKVVKFAGMPQKRSDVLRLMSETLRFSEDHPDVTVVTMAMGQLGKMTRLAGDSFGSAWSFAAVSGASAPGQMSLESMLQYREELSK